MGGWTLFSACTAVGPPMDLPACSPILTPPSSSHHPASVTTSVSMSRLGGEGGSLMQAPSVQVAPGVKGGGSGSEGAVRQVGIEGGKAMIFLAHLPPSVIQLHIQNMAVRLQGPTTLPPASPHHKPTTTSTSTSTPTHHANATQAGSGGGGVSDNILTPPPTTPSDQTNGILNTNITNSSSPPSSSSTGSPSHAGAVPGCVMKSAWSLPCLSSLTLEDCHLEDFNFQWMCKAGLPQLEHLHIQGGGLGGGWGVRWVWKRSAEMFAFIVIDDDKIYILFA